MHTSADQNYLGHEFESVLLDCQAGLNADAIVRCAALLLVAES